VANVFTSVFVSRAMFQFALGRQGFNPKLSIGI
jgi:preprotein translocase subunit SecD